MLKPLHDYVVLEKVKEEVKTKSGIILTTGEAKEAPSMGLVIAVGPGKVEDGKLIEIDLKCGMMKSSRQSIVLADHSKFGKVYMSRLSERCDIVITDTRLKDYDYEWLTNECMLLFADEKQKT